MKVEIIKNGVMSLISESEWEDGIIKLYYYENKDKKIGETIQFNPKGI